MKTTTTTLKVSGNDDPGLSCPLPPSVIPNYMGINLCSVDSITWTKRDDGQLTDLSITFIPDTPGDPE